MNDIKFPVRYEERIAIIEDANAEICVVISINPPLPRHHEIGTFIAEAMNEKHEREQLRPIERKE